MRVSVPAAEAARVGVARIGIGQLSIGTIVVDQLTVSNARVGITAGRAELRNVHVTVGLDFELIWSIQVPLPWPFDDITISETTTSLGGIDIPFDFGDAEIPGLRDINLNIASLTASNLNVQADPIRDLQLTGLVAEGIQAGDVILPTAGFGLAGLALTALTVNAVAVPAVSVGTAAIGRLRGDPLSLPALRLTGLALPSAATDDITSTGVEIPLTRAPIETPELDLGVLTVQLRIRPSARTRVGELRMTGVRASASAEVVELRQVALPYEAVDVTLEDLGIDAVDVQTIGVFSP